MERDSTDVQIFNEVVTIVSDAKFLADQMEFFEKHYSIFEDTEENKLEYSPIYESYVYILESVIDSKLKEKFQPSETEDFYKSFKANIKTYEEINSDALDVLYGFIDFDKFKDKMVKFKQNSAKEGTDMTAG